jgi:hypothetical protein
MPGLQDWVNKWVRVNKSSIRFPDDDELDEHRHVKIRQVERHPSAAAAVAGTEGSHDNSSMAMDIAGGHVGSQVPSNSYGAAHNPSRADAANMESFGTVHDMIMNGTSKHRLTRHAMRQQYNNHDDMSNSVTDNFQLNTYNAHAHKQPPRNKLGLHSRLKRKESKKMKGTRQGDGPEELNMSLSSSIHSRKSAALEGKTRLKRTNSQSDLLKVRAVEVKQNPRLRIQQLKYQSSYLAQMDAIHRGEDVLISQSMHTDAEPPSNSNLSHYFSKPLAQSALNTSSHSNLSSWSQTQACSSNHEMPQTNPLLYGKSSGIKSTAMNVTKPNNSTLRRKSSIGTASSSSARSTSGGAAIASVAARMYLNHLAFLEGAGRVQRYSQKNSKLDGVGDATVLTEPGASDGRELSRKEDGTCSPRRERCEHCLQKEERIWLLEQELKSLKGSSMGTDISSHARLPSFQQVSEAKLARQEYHAETSPVSPSICDTASRVTQALHRQQKLVEQVTEDKVSHATLDWQSSDHFIIDLSFFLSFVHRPSWRATVRIKCQKSFSSRAVGRRTHTSVRKISTKCIKSSLL